MSWWNRKARLADELRATLAQEQAKRQIMQGKVHALETEVAELWEIVALLYAGARFEGEVFFSSLRCDLKHGDKLKKKLEGAKHENGTR